MQELIGSFLILIGFIGLISFLVLDYNNSKVIQYCYNHTSNYIEYKTCREKPTEELNYLIYKEKNNG